jgi:hypothetical protein
MGAVVVTMAILLIPGDRKNNAPSGIQDRSCSIPPKIHLASDARPPILNTTAGRCRRFAISSHGSLPVPLQPTDMQNWTLLLPHRRMLLRLPYRRGAVVPRSPSAVFMVSRRDPRWPRTGRTAEPAGGFGDDPEGFLGAPSLDSAPMRFRAAYR